MVLNYHLFNVANLSKLPTEIPMAISPKLDLIGEEPELPVRESCASMPGDLEPRPRLGQDSQSYSPTKNLLELVS